MVRVPSRILQLAANGTVERSVDIDRIACNGKRQPGWREARDLTREAVSNDLNCAQHRVQLIQTSFVTLISVNI